jgi:hypothetical protein
MSNTELGTGVSFAELAAEAAAQDCGSVALKTTVENVQNPDVLGHFSSSI